MERFQGHGVCIQRKGGSPFLFIVGNKGSGGRGQKYQQFAGNLRFSAKLLFILHFGE